MTTTKCQDRSLSRITNAPRVWVSDCYCRWHGHRWREHHLLLYKRRLCWWYCLCHWMRGRKEWTFINAVGPYLYKHSAFRPSVVNDWSYASVSSFLSHPPEGYVASFEDHASSLIKMSLVCGQCNADYYRTYQMPLQ